MWGHQFPISTGAAVKYVDVVWTELMVEAVAQEPSEYVLIALILHQRFIFFRENICHFLTSDLEKNLPTSHRVA